MQHVFHYQPAPRFGHVAVDYNQKVYLWGGCTHNFPVLPTKKLSLTCVEVYNLETGSWTKAQCTGSLPVACDGYTYTRDCDKLYVFGGWNGDVFFNCLHQLSLHKLEWREIKHVGHAPLPSKKARAGLAKCGDNLILFGGYGSIPLASQTAGKQHQLGFIEMEGLTNELHTFSLSESTWNVQTSSATPPPCSSFSFVPIGNGCIVKFGGRQPDGCTNSVHILDINMWVWSKVESAVPGGPSARGGHAACYIAGKLMITGGRDNDVQVLGDAWTLDTKSMEWSQPQLRFSESTLRRCCHSATIISGSSSNETRLVIFGGISWWCDTGTLATVAQTTVVHVDLPSCWTLSSYTRQRSHTAMHTPSKLGPVMESTMETQLEREVDKTSIEGRGLDATQASKEKKGAGRASEKPKPLVAGVVPGSAKQAKKRRHSHPVKKSSAHSHRRSTLHDLHALDRSWMVRIDEVVMLGETLQKAGSRGIQVALFRGLKVAAQVIQSSKECAVILNNMDRVMQLHHPNIVQLMGVVIHNGIVILSELIPTDLASVLSTKGLGRGLVISVALDVGRALNYLHLMRPKPMCHGALNTANVFLESAEGDKWRAKIACNSLFCAHCDSEDQAQGQFADVTNDSNCTPEADVHSYGIVLMDMIGLHNAAFHSGVGSDHQCAFRWSELEDIAMRCMEENKIAQPSMADVLLNIGLLK